MVLHAHRSLKKELSLVKFNMKIHFPPPFSQQSWHHKDANTELMKRVMVKLNRQRAFLNSTANEKVAIFNKNVLNILSYLIPHETIVRDDKDPP